MARGGVTYSDIANAADTIKNKGQNPTVDRVLNLMGTGSKSTIGPHLKAWKEANLEHNEVSDLPTNLITAVRELHQRLQSEADALVESANQKMAIQKVQQREEIEKLSNEINSLTKLVKELQQNEVSLVEENKSLNKYLEKTNLRITHLETKKDSDEQMIEELRKSRDKMHHQLKLAHEQQEHYQLKIAEERAIERNENQAIKANLSDQISVLNRQLNEANEHLSHSQKQADELSIRLQSLGELVHTLERDAVKKDSIISSLEEKRIQNERNITESLDINKELNALKLTQSNQISSLTSECSILKEMLSVARKDIELTRDRLESKTEAFLEVCQEKKTLESQLITLQNSLEL
jgi:chromosome segregation ATPase